MPKETLSTGLAVVIAIIVVWFVIGMQIGGPNGTETEVEEEPIVEVNPKDDLIVLYSPTPDSSVSSPLEITGQARGYWFFEATFPITLTNWDGLIIAEGYAEAVLDPNDPDSTWMTEDFVPFKAVINFTIPDETLAVSNRGSLILRKDNPSGLPEHDDHLEITVFFEK